MWSLLFSQTSKDPRVYGSASQMMNSSFSSCGAAPP